MSAKRTYNAFVGRIPGHIDEFMMELALEQCGAIQRWVRLKDPFTGKRRNFGICEFTEPNGAVEAALFLPELAWDGTPLLVNLDDDTKEYIANTKGKMDDALLEKRKMKRFVIAKVFTEGSRKAGAPLPTITHTAKRPRPDSPEPRRRSPRRHKAMYGLSQ